MLSNLSLSLLPLCFVCFDFQRSCLNLISNHGKHCISVLPEWAIYCNVHSHDQLMHEVMDIHLAWLDYQSMETLSPLSLQCLSIWCQWLLLLVFQSIYLSIPCIVRFLIDSHSVFLNKSKKWDQYPLYPFFPTTIFINAISLFKSLAKFKENVYDFEKGWFFVTPIEFLPLPKQEVLNSAKV